MTGAVPARASVITLGARDIDALKAFYNGLGWKLAVDLDGFAAFELRGAVLALFPLDELALDANAPAASSEHGLRGFTISINVDQREQVDETIAAVSEAGGRISKPPIDVDWGGRSAYFVDPEDNFWEIAWVPPDSRMAGAIERATSPRA